MRNAVSSSLRRTLTWRARWAVVIAVVVLASGCSDVNNVPTSPSTTGIPSEITLTHTVVNLVAPPTSAIIATVRDENSAPVSGLTVTFTTSSGFITSGTMTGVDGVAIGILTGTIGAHPTVTASVTVDTTTVTATTVVDF
jgi:hypothetical protein